MAVIPEEIRATVKLYLDGKIREWYSRGDGKGVIVLLDVKTEEEARAIVETLPLVKEQLMVGMSSATAWAMICRSNGSRRCSGKSKSA
jgi:hypothetical protein